MPASRLLALCLPSHVWGYTATISFTVTAGSVAKSDRYYNVAWDLGLMALRPGGGKLAMLAATDTE